jgi:hypothetical protein
MSARDLGELNKVTNIGEDCHAVSLAELLLNKCTLASLGFTGAAHKCAVDFDNAQTPDARGGALRALLDACGIRRGPSDFLSTARLLAAACSGIGVYNAGFTILINSDPGVEGYKCLGVVRHSPGHWAAAAISAGNYVRYYVHLLVVPLPWSCICGHENDHSETKCGSCNSPVLETRQNWKCPICELLNPSSRPACGRPACGGRNPASAMRAISKPAAVASDTWACGVCSFVNYGELPVCETCEAPRGAPPAAPKPAAGASDWACDTCSFVNYGELPVCETCEAPRGAPPAAPKPAAGAADWACDTCTFANNGELPVCYLCRTERGA